MWNPRLEFSDNNHLCKVAIDRDDQPMTFADVIAGWKRDPGFQKFYVSLIAGMPFEAVFWESPAITQSSVNQRYECVVVDSVRLANVEPNPSAFERYFNLAADDETVVTFENLGKDAWLVVPCPTTSASAYTHLAKFLRTAPDTQCNEFLQVLGEAIEKRLDDRPLWVNTSGLGIYWLHARLDSRPKYYTFSPYKAFA